ncbi:hypothetical protein [Rhodothermus profundi]|uniref:Lipoprotein n=1 Tax=Rhodothermus profundi TaxID=633813 RepID=A0A1M6RU83_9BACT|nr:hypothetical protein [Rhodothermus profundi]SHK35930.1 hypothetical protein SAMN04488087_0962 [Rhodothermus profundi]
MRYGTGLLLLSLLLLGCEAERVLGPLPPASLPKEGPAPLPSVSSGALPQVSGDRWAEVAWLQQVRRALGAPYVAFVSWRDEAGRWRYRYVVLRVPRRWVRESGGREQVYWFRREWGCSGGRCWRGCRRMSGCCGRCVSG